MRVTCQSEHWNWQADRPVSRYSWRMGTSLHTGGCLCGVVRYEIRGELGQAYYCHCSLCRKLSGSAFSANAVVAMTDFTVVQGQGALKAHTNDKGVSRWFCGQCGSPIYVSQGEQMRLRLGGLDTPLDTPPQMHIYTDSKADWFTVHDGLPQHPQQPVDAGSTPATVTLPPSPLPELHTLELAPAQAPLLQAFFDANADYFVIVNGEPAAVGEAMEEITGELPAGFSYTKKWVIGYADASGTLVAMANVVTDLLAPNIWHVGLFMVADSLHGTGIAHALYQGLEDWAAANGATWLRLGVVQGHARAERFWQSLGFAPVRTRENVDMGKLTNTIVVMVKPLTGETLAQYLQQVPRDQPA